MRRETRDFWINQGLFQLSWPACVVAAAWGVAGWTGPLVVGLLAAWQLHPAHRHSNDWRMLAVCLIIGFVLDSIWVRSGLLAYAMPWPSAQWAPFWIMLLWVAMALVLNHSMAIFKRHLVLIGVFGAVGSPMSYFAGARFGAVEWLAPAWQVVLATGLSWGLLLPLLFWLARRDEARPSPQVSSPSYFRSTP